jgi:hypothetical protein
MKQFEDKFIIKRIHVEICAGTQFLLPAEGRLR